MEFGRQPEKHFTATTYIVNNAKVLLLKHKKLNTWLPPGGHVESNELPHETALRESQEEMGLDIDFLITDENYTSHLGFLKQNDSRAKILPRPWQILLEQIGKKHYHIDFLYIAKPKQNEIKNTEDHDFKWFSKKELEQETQIFPNVKYFGILAIEEANK